MFDFKVPVPKTIPDSAEEHVPLNRFVPIHEAAVTEEGGYTSKHRSTFDSHAPGELAQSLCTIEMEMKEALKYL